MRQPWNLTLIGIILLLLGVVVVLLTIAFVHPEPCKAILTHLGAVMIGAAVVELVIHLFAMDRLVGRVTGEVLAALKFPISAFYLNREALDPLTQELKDVRELWVAWHSGTVALTKQFFTRGRGGRMILTN